MSEKRKQRLLAAALIILGLTPAPSARATPEKAHEHYVRAVEHVRQGNPRAAKLEFERAFELSPHHVVLFNLGNVTLELGELEEARRYFARFLQEGGDAVPPERRAEAEMSIRDIDEKLAERATAKPEPATRATPATPAPIAEQPPPTPRPSARRAEDTRRDSEDFAPIVSRERRRTLAYGLGVTGAAVLAAGAGVLLWNGNRKAEAEARSAELAGNAPDSEIADDEALARAIEHERAVAHNQAELDAIQDFDVVGYTAVGIGAALLGTGIALYVTSGSESSVNVRAGVGSIAVSKTW